MHVRVDEQTDVWRSVHVEQRKTSDNKCREVDQHFAEVQSWRDELTALVADLVPVSKATVGRRGSTSSARSKSENPHRMTGTVSSVRGDEVRTLRKQLEYERQLYARRAQQWATEKRKLVALHRFSLLREKELQAALQRHDEQETELKRSQTAVEQRERDLDAAHEQWSREAAERARAFDSREKLLDDQQLSLDALRHRLEDQSRRLHEETRRLEITPTPLDQHSVTHEPKDAEPVEPICDPVVVPAELHLNLPVNVPESPATHHSESKAPVEAESTDAACAEPDGNDRESCFDEISWEQVSEDSGEFDELIDRLVAFHRSKTRKWYMFWR